MKINEAYIKSQAIEYITSYLPVPEAKNGLNVRIVEASENRLIIGFDQRYVGDATLKMDSRILIALSKYRSDMKSDDYHYQYFYQVFDLTVTCGVTFDVFIDDDGSMIAHSPRASTTNEIDFLLNIEKFEYMSLFYGRVHKPWRGVNPKAWEKVSGEAIVACRSVVNNMLSVKPNNKHYIYMSTDESSVYTQVEKIKIKTNIENIDETREVLFHIADHINDVLSRYPYLNLSEIADYQSRFDQSRREIESSMKAILYILESANRHDPTFEMFKKINHRCADKLNQFDNLIQLMVAESERGWLSKKKITEDVSFAGIRLVKDEFRSLQSSLKQACETLLLEIE